MFRHISRYLVVSVLCAGIYNLVMFAGAWIGVHYAVSTVVAFVLIVATGYVLHCTFTFSQTFGWGSAVRYGAVMLVNLPVNLGLMFVLHDLLHVPVPVASVALTVILFAWNFLMSRWAILRRPVPKSSEVPL